MVSIKNSLGEGIIRILEGVTFSQKEFEKLLKSVNDEEHQEIKELVFEKTLVSAERIVDNWNNDIKSMAEKSGKKIDFKTDISNDLKVTKTLAHLMNVELGHLYRNSLDHGIEMPEKRKKLGKPEKGTISISICEEDGRLNLILRDDGSGLDNDKIIKAARENSALNQQLVEEYIKTEQIWKILFLKGFSSKEVVTEISGRGVGLDSVKDILERINGSINMSSESSKGSTFTVNIPMI